MESIKNIVYVTICVFFIVNIIVNKELRELLKNFLNKKISKLNIYVKDIVLAIVIVIFIIWTVKVISTVKDDVKILTTSTEMTDNILELNRQNVEKQNKKYNELINFNVDVEKCKKPYIPDGFKYIEGKWNTGFVIEDENKNQFVWIPCTNKKNEENIPILEKKNLVANPYISYFYCYESDDNYIDFIKSAMEYEGFYVSRFEIGKEEDKAVSKIDANIWTNISVEEAKKISESMYDNINSNLINGYAYDTIFSFIYDEIDIMKIEKSKMTSGTKAYKNIYDIVDDMYEFTSEIEYSEIVYRGFNLEKFEDIDMGIENTLNTRFSCDAEYKSEKNTFRTVIYK